MDNQGDTHVFLLQGETLNVLTLYIYIHIYMHTHTLECTNKRLKDYNTGKFCVNTNTCRYKTGIQTQMCINW